MADALPGALARRRPRLADLPAAPLLALLPLVPKAGPRAYLHVRPAGDGRVIVEGGGGPLVGVIELRGTVVRELALPRAGMALLARRHPRAERLAVDGALPDGPALLRLAALDADSSATVLAPEAELQPGTVSALLEDPPLWAGDERACFLNLKLLSQAADTMRSLCPGALYSAAMPKHDLLGCLLRAELDGDGDVVSACIALARCIAMPEGQGVRRRERLP